MGIFERVVPVDGVATYEGDYAAWAFDQARRLRNLRSNDLDVSNIAEELEDLGRGEVRKFESLLTIVILHLLKWDKQSSFRSRSWGDSVREHQRRVDRHLSENPSLRAVVDEAILEAFRRARYEAVQETGLSERAFPDANPYDWNTIMTRQLKLGDPE